MLKNRKIVDLKEQNFEFSQKDETIKLLSFDKEKMSLEIAIFKNKEFVKNSSMVFAHLPKSLKAKLNPKTKS
ncbi:malate dehydrogenase [Aliarcobacter trophiarum LMG 25534]|uniref:Malate dehydrogenase n=1 Tax=Aliarcobacter trophiarum LMG 25534 TaxID=1032241 RepID=A0ABY0EXZ8_9BACT|nr:malate dehydrogenase [Aliarcobacter trophiarum LMG 25534]